MTNKKHNCPICKSSLHSSFFEGGFRPLATLGWPASEREAVTMDKYSLNYVQCMRCTHIWNPHFDYTVIPYEKNPNRMFNDGISWKTYLKSAVNKLVQCLPERPVIIDIGCGEGQFLRALQSSVGKKGSYFGFDPNVSSSTGVGIDFIPEYFEPIEGLKRYQPDLVCMRHVLEHLKDPAEFVEQLAVGAEYIEKPVYFFAETPCVDIAITSNRVVDFFYEHPSQFTETSFTELMKLGGEVSWVKTGYGDEVVHGLLNLGLSNSKKMQKEKSKIFFEKVRKNKKQVQFGLFERLTKNKRIAIWGGTGKAATFVQHYELNRDKFPLVVDSDIQKVGTFVPGSGQEIKYCSYLLSNPADVIVITTQWRACDIYNEIREKDIQYEEILIEYDGKLLDFEKDEHPYK